MVPAYFMYITVDFSQHYKITIQIYANKGDIASLSSYTLNSDPGWVTSELTFFSLHTTPTL